MESFTKGTVNSETASLGHFGEKVTSLLRPLFFGRLAKTVIHFLVKKTLVNTAIGHRINGVTLYLSAVIIVGTV